MNDLSLEVFGKPLSELTPEDMEEAITRVKINPVQAEILMKATRGRLVIPHDCVVGTGFASLV
ncbi:hypothetical protein KKD19_05675 [Patescibacteria group bacterium]|nr:hypothetical protein [Patescibacteria group bacterium]